MKCYELRLREAAGSCNKKANFDYFTTTLSISPMKNAVKLNEIGMRLAEEYQVAYLLSDFKKKNGYKRSIEIIEGIRTLPAGLLWMRIFQTGTRTAESIESCNEMYKYKQNT